MARYIPTENTYFEASPAKAVSCGGDHTLVLLESGEVVGFGWNEKGPLGHNDSQNLLFPRKINVKNVTQTAGGGYAHSLFLLDDGSVVALGWCESGQCGVDDLAMTHITIPTYAFKRISP
jgi:alpha-tubulin suppressor-like RCC1 family protein